MPEKKSPIRKRGTELRSLFNAEEGRHAFFRNVDGFLPDYTALHSLSYFSNLKLTTHVDFGYSELHFQRFQCKLRIKFS
jgi:hypothetical protein